VINQVYQLVSPKVFSVAYVDLSFDHRVIVRPEYMSICQADQRYFQGKRDARVLRQKLPMALIHECCGRVIHDPEGILRSGQRVVLVPNIPTRQDAVTFENYRKGSYFLSSGHDGFMRELVSLERDRVIPYQEIAPMTAAVTEFVSVAVHAAARFDLAAHTRRDRIGIWGDGSLGYVMANILRIKFPASKLIVVGHNPKKLAHFSFVDAVYLAGELPEGLSVDHAFECCGGEGSDGAIEAAVHHIEPQGTLMLLGVSENRVPVNTRTVLEKGLTLVGCSRSGRADFEQALSLMRQSELQRRLRVILYEDAPVRTEEDIYRVFATDVTTPFKTVFRWEL
jgi:ribitol-5-phosphate 2-dehydrogenase